MINLSGVQLFCSCLSESSEVGFFKDSLSPEEKGIRQCVPGQDL